MCGHPTPTAHGWPRRCGQRRGRLAIDDLSDRLGAACAARTWVGSTRWPPICRRSVPLRRLLGAAARLALYAVAALVAVVMLTGLLAAAGMDGMCH
jgi:hypothetical protein